VVRYLCRSLQLAQAITYLLLLVCQWQVLDIVRAVERSKRVRLQRSKQGVEVVRSPCSATSSKVLCTAAPAAGSSRAKPARRSAREALVGPGSPEWSGVDLDSQHKRVMQGGQITKGHRHE